jgi:hypothetical protein
MTTSSARVQRWKDKTIHEAAGSNVLASVAKIGDISQQFIRWF